MRNNKINYFAVGIFVILMAVGLVVSIAQLTGQSGATDRYFAVYNNVSGVKFGTQVVYEGYPIGQVQKVTPQEREGKMEFRVDFEVAQGWRIPNDSIVEIASPGLLSAKTLSISAGFSSDPSVVGERLNSREASNVFGAVNDLAAQFSDMANSDIRPFLRNLDQTVKEINSFMVGDGKVLIGDVTKLVQDITNRVPGIAEDIDQFAGNMNKTSIELRKLITPKNRVVMEKIITNLDAATETFGGSLEALNKTLDDIDGVVMSKDGDINAILGETRYIVQSVSRNIDSINQNMEAAARNMNEFSRQIRANPGLLLSGSPQQDQALKQ